MKTSTVLASLLFGTLTVAAPFDKRVLVVKTEVVTETVVVYTTVYDDQPVAPVTTTPQGQFYEAPSSIAAKPTSAAPAPEEKKPSNVYTAPPVPDTPTPTPTPVPTPQPEQPKPVTSEAAYTPAPVVSSVVAPAPVASSVAPVVSPKPQSQSTGQTYSGDITIHYYNGDLGACGKNLQDTDMVVALAKSTWGESTYNVMTGEATNPWCGQKIKIEYNGKSVEAAVMDLCPGCAGAGIDLSLGVWNALGITEITRIHGVSWSKIA